MKQTIPFSRCCLCGAGHKTNHPINYKECDNCNSECVKKKRVKKRGSLTDWGSKKHLHRRDAF